MLGPHPPLGLFLLTSAACAAERERVSLSFSLAPSHARAPRHRSVRFFAASLEIPQPPSFPHARASWPTAEDAGVTFSGRRLRRRPPGPARRQTGHHPFLASSGISSRPRLRTPQAANAATPLPRASPALPSKNGRGKLPFPPSSLPFSLLGPVSLSLSPALVTLHAEAEDADEALPRPCPHLDRATLPLPRSWFDFHRTIHRLHAPPPIASSPSLAFGTPTKTPSRRSRSRPPAEPQLACASSPIKAQARSPFLPLASSSLEWSHLPAAPVPPSCRLGAEFAATSPGLLPAWLRRRVRDHAIVSPPHPRALSPFSPAAPSRSHAASACVRAHASVRR